MRSSTGPTQPAPSANDAGLLRQLMVRSMISIQRIGLAANRLYGASLHRWRAIQPSRSSIRWMKGPARFRHMGAAYEAMHQVGRRPARRTGCAPTASILMSKGLRRFGLPRTRPFGQLNRIARAGIPSRPCPVAAGRLNQPQEPQTLFRNRSLGYRTTVPNRAPSDPGGGFRRSIAAGREQGEYISAKSARNHVLYPAGVWAARS